MLLNKITYYNQPYIFKFQYDNHQRRPPFFSAILKYLLFKFYLIKHGFYDKKLD
jgi:hypothetical protein